MNPGISEETGQTARSIVDALKSQPAMILLVLFIGAFVYSQQRQLGTRDENLRQLFASQQVLFEQWKEIVTRNQTAAEKFTDQQVAMADKLIHCVAADDAIKLVLVNAPPLSLLERSMLGAPIVIQP